MKLDNRSSFIAGLAGLERLRETFSSTDLTLVVSPEAADLAIGANVADRVLVFDRVSPDEAPTEQHKSRFEQLVTDEYDLAIDLRVSSDTRPLLSSVRAPLRAGLGRRDVFPDLDIALPLGPERDGIEAEHEVFDHHAFASKDELTRTAYRIAGHDLSLPCDNALIWGPYRPLRSGRYVFEPFLELDGARDRALLIDVALDTQRVCGLIVPTNGPVRLPFTVARDGAEAEFRLWAVEGAPLANFSFYGGRLIRDGADSLLHEAEYVQLLVELVRLRLARTGWNPETGRP